MSLGGRETGHQHSRTSPRQGGANFPLRSTLYGRRVGLCSPSGRQGCRCVDCSLCRRVWSSRCAPGQGSKGDTLLCKLRQDVAVFGHIFPCCRQDAVCPCSAGVLAGHHHVKCCATAGDGRVGQNVCGARAWVGWCQASDFRGCTGVGYLEQVHQFTYHCVVSSGGFHLRAASAVVAVYVEGLVAQFALGRLSQLDAAETLLETLGAEPIIEKEEATEAIVPEVRCLSLSCECTSIS